MNNCKSLIILALSLYACAYPSAPKNITPLAYIYSHMPEIQVQMGVVNQLNIDFQRAVKTNNSALADSVAQRLMPAYASALQAYKQVYQDGGIQVNPNFMSPMMVTLYACYNMLLQSMNMHVQYLKKEQQNIKKFSTDITEFIKLIDSYDAYVQKLSTSLFGDLADAGSSNYTQREAAILLDSLTDSLKVLSQKTAQFDNPQSLADQLYGHASTYLIAYAQKVGEKKAVRAKKDYTRYMARTIDVLAKKKLKELDFQKKSSKENEDVFNNALRSFKKEASLYKSIADTNKAAIADRQARIIQSKVADYKKANSVYQRGVSLAKNNKIDPKKEGLQLLNQAYDLYTHVGDAQSRQLARYYVEVTSGDIGVLQAQQDLQQYTNQANAAITTMPTTGISADQQQLRKTEFLSGIIARQDISLLSHASQSYREAIDHYTAANQILLQQPVVISAPIDLITNAQKILSYIVDAYNTRVQGDLAAQQLSSVGLQQAQLNYQQARLSYQQADNVFSTIASDQFKTYMPVDPRYVSSAPNMSYVSLFNNYVGQFYIEICKPITKSDPSTVLDYYAAIAAQGVDMTSAINEIKVGIDFVALARKAADQARALTPDMNNWVAVPDAQGYISAADSSWRKAEGLYETAINDGSTEIIPEYISFIHEYADQYSNHVSADYFPLIGATNIYYRALGLFFNSPETNAIAQLEGYINTMVQQINAQVTVLTNQVTGAMNQNNFSQAIKYQEQILNYETQKAPGSQNYLLGQSADDIKAVFIKTADIYKSWGAYQLNLKDYQNAYNNLAYSYSLYQQLGVTDLQDIRQKYFLSKTLLTAWTAATSVYTAKSRLVGSLTVPVQYFLKEYVQALPEGVPTQGNPTDIARAVFIAHMLADEGIQYAQVYNPGTFDRVSSLDQETSSHIDEAEKAADNYKKQYMVNADYKAELFTQDSQIYLKETNKQIAIVDAPYSDAPTAMGYYLVALNLYKPGTSIITVNGQSFVPGQDNDDAWAMGRLVALAFLSDSVSYSDANVKIDTNSLQQFQALKNNVLEIYNRYSSAQDYFNGKDQAQNTKGPQDFATQANMLNLTLAQELQRDADLMSIFIKLAQSPDDVHSVADEAKRNYILARQYCIAYNQALGAADEYNIDQANKILLSVVNLNDASGDICVNQKNYFKSVAFYTNGTYYLQQLITHNVSSMQDLQDKQTRLEVKTNAAYFYGAADDVDRYYAIIGQPTVINNLSFGALLKKRTQAAQVGSTVTMSDAELNKYDEIEGLILDAITYYLLANDKFIKMVDPTKTDAVNKQADTLINNFITQQLKMTLDETAANSKFLRSAIAGYKQFVSQGDPDLKYGSLGLWAFKLYFSLCEEYIIVYLSSIDPNSQWDELNKNINTRLQAVTLSID